MTTELKKNELLAEQMTRLANRLEAIRIADYMELMEKPRKLIFTNFIAGVFRGLGFAVGTTIIFAVVVESLRRIVLINIPVINDYLIELVRIIEIRN
jgi:hypothetical protein